MHYLHITHRPLQYVPKWNMLNFSSIPMHHSDERHHHSFYCLLCDFDEKIYEHGQKYSMI
jgi:hypothetical protein